MTFFIKACGLGNDFVMLEEPQVPLPALSQKLANRRYGVGCDQIIYFRRRLEPDALDVRFFNADGSEAESCGNGTRCLARWFMEDKNLDACVLHTPGGTLACEIAGHDVAVTYAHPKLEPQIFTAEIHGVCDAVYVGNPHLVCFTNRLEELEALAPALENHPHFPNRTNVGFADVCSTTHMRLRVWERGAGLTPACGSGACAAAFAAYKRGLTEATLQVEQNGGSLTVHIGPNQLTMVGEARTIYTGTLNVNTL